MRWASAIRLPSVDSPAELSARVSARGGDADDATAPAARRAPSAAATSAAVAAFGVRPGPSSAHVVTIAADFSDHVAAAAARSRDRCRRRRCWPRRPGSRGSVCPFAVRHKRVREAVAVARDDHVDLVVELARRCRRSVPGDSGPCRRGPGVARSATCPGGSSRRSPARRSVLSCRTAALIARPRRGT